MMTEKTKPAAGDGDTRLRILDFATKMFALKGFKAVTLKEIAKAVGIKIASIYYYYEDKDALIEDVLSRFEEVYRDYHDWLSEMNGNAETLDEVMANLFNPNLLAKLSPIIRLGMSMTLKEQHNHDIACRFAFEHFYEDGVDNVQAGFDRLIQKGVIPPSDTKTLATLFMFCVMSGNEVRMHEYADTKAPINCDDAYRGLRQLMAASLSQGILKV